MNHENKENKEIKKREIKRAALKEQIQQFIVDHEMGSPDYLRTSQFVAQFIEHGEKQVRRIIKEL